MNVKKISAQLLVNEQHVVKQSSSKTQCLVSHVNTNHEIIQHRTWLTDIHLFFPYLYGFTVLSETNTTFIAYYHDNVVNFQEVVFYHIRGVIYKNNINSDCRLGSN